MKTTPNFPTSTWTSFIGSAQTFFPKCQFPTKLQKHMFAFLRKKVIKIVFYTLSKQSLNVKAMRKPSLSIQNNCSFQG